MTNFNSPGMGGPPQVRSGKLSTQWVILGLVLLVSLLGFSSGVGGFLLIFAFFGIVLSLVVLATGRGRWMWLAGRKQASFALAGALVLFIIGGSLVGARSLPPTTPVAAESASTRTESKPAAPTSPSASPAVQTPSPSPSPTLTQVRQPAPVPLAQVPVQPKQEPAPQPPVQQAPAPQPAQPEVPKQPAAVFYKNCDAVRAAGAAPLYVGQPGYRPQLDRDGDGIACEPKPKGKK